jgi:hypothetical protein
VLATTGPPRRARGASPQTAQPPIASARAAVKALRFAPAGLRRRLRSFVATAALTAALASAQSASKGKSEPFPFVEVDRLWRARILKNLKKRAALLAAEG